MRSPATVRRVEAVGAGRHNEARGKAFDVPLPRSLKGLVEVVEVEEQGALRGGVSPKVRKVGVAAQLSLDAGLRSASEGLRAMMMADPRRNAKGEAIMRPYRIGTSSGILFLACISRRSTGSGRSGAGAHPA